MAMTGGSFVPKFRKIIKQMTQFNNVKSIEVKKIENFWIFQGKRISEKVLKKVI